MDGVSAIDKDSVAVMNIRIAIPHNGVMKREISEIRAPHLGVV